MTRARTLVCLAALAPWGCSSTQSAADGGSSDAAALDASDAANPNGDQFGPWAGGAAYYAKFGNGPPSDPSFFPISVWLQSPSSATAYAAIGINQYIGLYQGPTDQMLTDLATAKMPAFCDQNSVGLAHLTDKTIAGWTQQDEPDNAQPVDGGYGPCVAPATIQSLYQTMRVADSTRPVFLNLGQGVANDAWVGRGSCSNQPQDYPEYCKGADIVSFDVYPINDGLDITLPAKGVDRLMQAVDDQKPVWDWIECTRIDQSNPKPTPDQVKAEVWMSIIHGAMGIGYFVHQFTPTFDEHALLDDATMKAAVAVINQQIHDLAPALNTPPIVNAATVSSSATGVPIDILVKRQGGKLYVFAVSMGAAQTMGTFTLAKVGAASADVLGEARQIAVAGGAFTDTFAPYAVHLYAVQ
ncbi:MAG TPA: hypothetical protein VLM85_16480 [Polyangiaceae bacterium]|nr:hypothetical protein [Polyangiaceae bacterium]